MTQKVHKMSTYIQKHKTVLLTFLFLGTVAFLFCLNGLSTKKESAPPTVTYVTTPTPTYPPTESIKDKAAITKKLTGLTSGQQTTYNLKKIAISISLPSEFQSTMNESYRYYNEKDDRIGIYCAGPDIILTSQDVCVDKSFWIVSHSRKGFNIFEGSLDFTGYHSYRCDNTGCGITRWERPVKYLPKELYTEIKNSSGVQILKIIGKNNDYNPEFPNAPRAYSGTPGEGKIGAIVNLPDNPTYSGVVIVMKLTDTLTEQVFDQILNSIRIIE